MKQKKPKADIRVAVKSEIKFEKVKVCQYPKSGYGMPFNIKLKLNMICALLGYIIARLLGLI